MNKSVNNVYQTANLSQFKRVHGNRPANPKHVANLAASIKSNGMLCQPIIVNENLEVIDGQHRLEAAKKVGSGIYFIIVQGYSRDQMLKLNLNQKNWTKADYMNSYAEQGVESYKRLKRLVDNEPFNLDDIITIVSGTLDKNQTRDSRSEFNDGVWAPDRMKFNETYIFLQKAKRIKEYYSGYNKSSFVTALYGIMKNKPEFNFDEFINKLSYQQGKLIDCTTRTAYKQLIEDIYNYKRRGDFVSLRY